MMRRALRRLSLAARAEDGVSAVEFAFVMPLMMLMLFGGFDLSRMSAIARKVTLTTRAVADLTTQSVSLSSSSLGTILNASAQIFAPYSTTPMVIVVSELSINASGAASVAWSQALNGAALPAGQVVAVPSALAQPNTSVVWCTITYTYTPLVSPIFGTAKVMSDQIYMSPRLSDSISLSG